MLIGIMMQSFDETMGGIGVYTLEIVRALFQTSTAGGRTRGGTCWNT